MNKYEAFHPVDCECNKPSVIQSPAPLEIIADLIRKVLIGMIVSAIAFLVVFVGYSFITA